MNAILGTVAECLHYYRCCHYDTYIQVKIDKSMTKSHGIVSVLSKEGYLWMLSYFEQLQLYMQMLRKDSCRVRNKVGGPGGMFPWEIFKFSEPRECYFQNSSTSVEAVNKVIF